jgi:hypothetical protein
MRYLLPIHVYYIGFQLFCETEVKGLTVKVECNAGQRHSDCQYHNSLIFVPNRNTNGNNGRLILKIALHGTIDEDVRAKDNQ